MDVPFHGPLRTWASVCGYKKPRPGGHPPIRQLWLVPLFGAKGSIILITPFLNIPGSKVEYDGIPDHEPIHQELLIRVPFTDNPIMYSHTWPIMQYLHACLVRNAFGFIGFKILMFYSSRLVISIFPRFQDPDSHDHSLVMLYQPFRQLLELTGY